MIEGLPIDDAPSILLYPLFLVFYIFRNYSFALSSTALWVSIETCISKEDEENITLRELKPSITVDMTSLAHESVWCAPT